MKTFWILLILALLFVVGSASALRYFGNKSMPPSKPDARTGDDSDDSDDRR